MAQLDESPFYCASCIGRENKGLEYNQYLDRVGNKWRKGECLCCGSRTVQMDLHRRSGARRHLMVTVFEFPATADDHSAIYKVPGKDKNLGRLRALWADPQRLRTLGDRAATKLQDRATRSWKKKGYRQFMCYRGDEPHRSSSSSVVVVYPHRHDTYYY